MSGFEVLNGGVLSTIQDLGRVGLAHSGISEAGVLDELSYGYLCKLLENDFGANALEIAFGGLKLRVKGEVVFALSGATVEIKLNNKPIKMYKTYNAKDGDVLEVGFVTSGARVYLGVKGGFEVEQEFGSSSVSLKEGIGGRAIKRGDFLEFKPSRSSYSCYLKKEFQPKFETPIELRVVKAYQWDMFEDSQKEKFFNNTYEVTNQNDRMGYRLKGEKVFPLSGGIISEGIAYGAIQIPPHGEPIILLKERQTIGGYAKIGSVIRVDCFKLAQAKQGDKVKFRLVELAEAQKSCKKFNNFFSQKVIR